MNGKYSGVQTMWLRDQRFHPVACVAAEMVGPDVIRYAVSTWNPLDRFDRARGRQIAMNRLGSNRAGVTGEVVLMPGEGMLKCVLGAILMDDLDHPNRTRDAANRALNRLIRHELEKELVAKMVEAGAPGPDPQEATP